MNIVYRFVCCINCMNNKRHKAIQWAVFPVCAASIPVWGTKETACAGYWPYNSASQQLVSLLYSLYFYSILPQVSALFVFLNICWSRVFMLCPYAEGSLCVFFVLVHKGQLCIFFLLSLCSRSAVCFLYPYAQGQLCAFFDLVHKIVCLYALSICTLYKHFFLFFCF